MQASDLLELAARFPEVGLDDGDTIIREGEPSPALFVLRTGALRVTASGRPIARVAEPGAVVGEIGLLLGGSGTATVSADGPAVVHRIDDAAPLFAEHPELGRHLAVVLARRLRQVTEFLGDIIEQYEGRSDTLGLLPQVLGDVLSGTVDDVDVGSDREPDAPY